MATRMGPGSAALALLLLLAGCAGQDAPPVLDSSDQGRHGELRPLRETGTIEGSVTDDEMRPLENATVVVRGMDAQMLTAADGSFRFPNVPVGRLVVAAAKGGYEGQAREIEVAEAEPTTVKFVLTLVASLKPYVEIFPHNALHHVGAFTYTNYVAYLAGQEVVCSGCTWSVKTTHPPKAMLVEIFGKHTVSNPARRDSEYFRVINRNESLTSGFGGGLLKDCSVLDDCYLPLRLWLNETEIRNNKWFLNQMGGDFFWFQLEEKRETWTTLFHGYGVIPASFTATQP